MPLGTRWAWRPVGHAPGRKHKRKKPRSGRGFYLARQVGVEPTTVRLTVGCSATELLPTTVVAGRFRRERDSSTAFLILQASVESPYA